MGSTTMGTWGSKLKGISPKPKTSLIKTFSSTHDGKRHGERGEECPFYRGHPVQRSMTCVGDHAVSTVVEQSKLPHKYAYVTVITKDVNWVLQHMFLLF